MILEQLIVYLLSAPIYLYGTFLIQVISQFLPKPGFRPARPNSEGLLSCEELKHKFSPNKIQNAGSTTEPKRQCRSVEMLFFAMIIGMSHSGQLSAGRKIYQTNLGNDSGMGDIDEAILMNTSIP